MGARNHGHQTEDLILREVSRMRSRHMEHRGFVFRWGGEEFLLVYEQMNCDETAACLRELLTEMEQVGTLADGEESGLQWRLAW